MDVDEFAILRFPYKNFNEKKLVRQAVQAAKKGGWENRADDKRSVTQAVKAEFSLVYADRKRAAPDDMLDVDDDGNCECHSWIQDAQQFSRILCHHERTRAQDVFEL